MQLLHNSSSSSSSLHNSSQQHGLELAPALQQQQQHGLTQQLALPRLAQQATWLQQVLLGVWASPKQQPYSGQAVRRVSAQHQAPAHSAQVQCTLAAAWAWVASQGPPQVQLMLTQQPRPRYKQP
jgi:hypothetical protein